MSTELTEVKPVALPVLFSVTEATIRDQVQKYSSLTITDFEDEKQLEIVRKARLDCKDARCTIEREREAAKKPHLEAGKSIDAIAKKMTGMIEPTEVRLQGLENKVQKLKEEAEERRITKLSQDRKAKLDAAGGAHGPVDLRRWSDEQFETFLAECVDFNQRKSAQKKRDDDEREANRMEKIRLQKIADDLDAKQKEIDRKAAEQRDYDLGNARESWTVDTPSVVADEAARVAESNQPAEIPKVMRHHGPYPYSEPTGGIVRDTGLVRAKIAAEREQLQKLEADVMSIEIPRIASMYRTLEDAKSEFVKEIRKLIEWSTIKE